MTLSDILNKTIKENSNLDKEYLYNLCKQEIIKFDEQYPLSCKSYEMYINYITNKINYFEN